MHDTLCQPSCWPQALTPHFTRLPSCAQMQKLLERIQYTHTGTACSLIPSATSSILPCSHQQCQLAHILTHPYCLSHCPSPHMLHHMLSRRPNLGCTTAKRHLHSTTHNSSWVCCFLLLPTLPARQRLTPCAAAPCLQAHAAGRSAAASCRSLPGPRLAGRTAAAAAAAAAPPLA